MQTKYTYKEIWLIAYPILISLLMEQLIGMTDTAFLGRVGEVELGASAIAGVFYMVIFMVAFGFSIGAQILIARRNGEQQYKEIGDLFYQGIYFQVGMATVMFLLSYCFSPIILKRIVASEHIYEAATSYLHWRVFGAFFSFSAVMFRAFFLGTTQTKTLTLNSIVMVLSNVVFNYILIFGKFGFPQLGIAGAAIATVLSQAVSAILVLLALIRTSDIYKLHLRKVRFFEGSLSSILRIGIPAGLQAAMYSLSNIIIQTALNALGTDTVAAWTSFGKMDAFCWMVISAFGISATTFVGQNYGAGKYDRVRKSVRVCLGMTLASSIAMSIFLMTAGKYLFHLFTSDPEVIRIGIQILNYMAPAYALFVFIEIYSGALRGIGDVIIPTIMTCCGVCVFRTLWVFLLVPKSPTIETITLSYPISWGITAVLFIIYYYKKQKKLGMENFDQ